MRTGPPVLPLLKTATRNQMSVGCGMSALGEMERSDIMSGSFEALLLLLWVVL
jgi:hypothetical protein